MKITFIMGGPNMSGGDRVCAIYAQKLIALGHEVNIIAPKRHFLNTKNQVKRVLKGQSWLSKSAQTQNHFQLLGLEVFYTNNYPPIKSSDVPDADIIIATWWETVEWVKDFPKEKGKKVYFIQHHETHDWLPIERVKKTYKELFHKITVASWLVKLMVEVYDSGPPYLVPNSVDCQMFNASKRTKQEVPTIGFLYSEVEFKGVHIALSVIENLKKKLPSLRIIAFGSKRPSALRLPDYVELTVNPNQEDIRLLYQQCDLWLCCSLVEGFGLTILESMACRTPVVSTKCGGAEDIITDGVNGFLCDVNDEASLMEAAFTVLEFNEQEWAEFSLNAYSHANSYSWDDATLLFQEALQKIALTSAGKKI